MVMEISAMEKNKTEEGNGECQDQWDEVILHGLSRKSSTRE
jgi:hypothetical protein